MAKGREDAEVPRKVRQEAIDRDGSCCRVCGRYVRYPALHHVDYRSEGGLHVLENLVTIGWLPGHDCHLPIVHANKRLWQPILEVVAVTPGITAFSLRRQLEGAGELTSPDENARSRSTAARLELPRAERPLAGWPRLANSDQPGPGIARGPSAV